MPCWSNKLSIWDSDTITAIVTVEIIVFTVAPIQSVFASSIRIIKLVQFSYRKKIFIYSFLTKCKLRYIIFL